MHAAVGSAITVADVDADLTFALIAAERRRLADLLAGLDEAQWAHDSLCAGWTVRQVAAHLVVPFEVSTPRMGLAVLKSLGRVDRAMGAVTTEVARRPTGELVELLRANAADRFTPPTGGPELPLTDAVVHGQDIARPLGLALDPDPEAVATTLDAMVGGVRFFVPRDRVRDLRFAATDLDWSHGDGPVVEGPAVDVLLAITGRPVGLETLDGDGAATLARRIGATG